MKSRTILFLSCLLSFTFIWADSDCTLKPEDGNKKAILKHQIQAEMTWTACNSIGRDVVFQLPLSEKLSTPEVALKRAVELVKEWEDVTNLKVGSTEEVVPALEKRATEKPNYVFGENIPVSDVNKEVPGFDGVTVEHSIKKEWQQLTVKYWANP